MESVKKEENISSNEPQDLKENDGMNLQGSKNNRRNNKRNDQKKGHNQYGRFIGREKSLYGHIYDYNGERSPDMFIRTTKEIANYIGRTSKSYSSDFALGIEELKLKELTEPTQPDPTNPIALEKWKYEYKEFKNKEQEYINFRSNLYNLVFGQCTDALQSRLRSHDDFNKNKQDGIELLKMIKSIIHTFEEHQEPADSYDVIKEGFYTLKQGKYMSLSKYYEIFKAHSAVMDDTIADKGLIKKIANENGNDEPSEEDEEQAKQRTLAIWFIKGTNDKYQEYKRHLRNSYLDGADHYPRNMHEAYNILQRRINDNQNTNNNNDGVAFTQTTQEQEGTTCTQVNRKKDLSNIKCFNCGMMGHYGSNCPYKNNNNNSEVNLQSTSSVTED